MTSILIGSKALSKWGLNRSKPKDWDFWYCGTNPHVGKKGYDCKEHHQDLLDLIPTVDGVVTPDAVYTIKCSHLGWDVHWGKTKADVMWLEANGCAVIPELYNALIDVWKKEHGDKSFLSLNQSKEEFFTDGVSYQFDHDYLHELVAHPNPPVYTRVLKEGQDVAIDKIKFDLLSYEEKVRMFREEVTVIACERWVLNGHWRGKISWYEAYGMALKRTITNLTKGWATDFIVCNLKDFVKPDYSYFKHLLTTLSEGIDMSKVDLSVFETAMEEYGYDSMGEFVYECCEGDVNVNYNPPDYPYRDGRGQDDPGYQEELNNYRTVCKAREDAAEAKLSVTYQHIDQEGGGEGGSEYCWGVFSLNGVTYKAEYSYYSYNGHEYYGILETLKEVKPVQKTTTVYE